MDVRSLQTRHPLCDVETFRRYDALYRGGSAFRNMLPEFLPRQPQDTDAIYQLRVSEASYRSYVGQIVRAYAGTLFASHCAIRSKMNGETVDLDPFYSTLKEDCDGQGTDLTSFFKNRFRNALVMRSSFWLVEMPRKSAEELGMSEDEWKAQGHDRARLRALDTASVLDWEADEDGCFAWVKVHERALRRTSPDAPAVVVDTWRIYYPERCDVYRIEYLPKKPPKPTATVPLVESYDHGCSRVPVLSMRLDDGLWLLDVAADAQTEHFRLSAALGWILRRGAYPLGVFKLDPASKDDPPKKIPGLGVVIGTEESFAWAEPSGTTIAQLREEIKSQKDEIYRVSQQMAMSADSSAGSMGRSGLSKMADAEATNACLRDYASFAREAIEATFELVSNARGDFDLTFSVEGLSTFSTQDIETIVDAAKAAKEFGIEDESETFRIESHCRIADLVLPSDASQNTKDAIREDIRKAKKSPKAGIDTGFPQSVARQSTEPNGESRTEDDKGTPPNRREK